MSEGKSRDGERESTDESESSALSFPICRKSLGYHQFSRASAANMASQAYDPLQEGDETSLLDDNEIKCTRCRKRTHKERIIDVMILVNMVLFLLAISLLLGISSTGQYVLLRNAEAILPDAVDCKSSTVVCDKRQLTMYSSRSRRRGIPSRHFRRRSQRHEPLEGTTQRRAGRGLGGHLPW